MKLSAYILTVIAAAVIAAILRRLMGDHGTSAAICKFLTGLVLTFTVISPLIDFNFSGMDDWMRSYNDDAQQAIQSGVADTSNTLKQIIKDKTEAYILDKARQLGADLTINIHLSDDDVPTPCAVEITGSIAPYAKVQLQNMIQSDLGIYKEFQTWT